jgi:DNA-binding transcriptional LysR family regulator
MATRLCTVNLNLLVALDALLRLRSVTRAAREVGVSQPAMSRSLKQLRELFDDPLLVRGKDGLIPTARAARLHSPLARTLEQLTQVVDDEAKFDAARSTRMFKVAMPDYLYGLLGARVTALMVDRAPHASVVFHRVDREAYAAPLERGELDLVVHACLEPPAGLMSTPLIRDRFACAVRSDHPAVAGDAIDLETYAALAHVLIMVSDDISPGSVDVALTDLGLQRHVACRVRSFLAAPLIVSQSDAIVTAPERLLTMFAKTHDLKVLEAPLALHRFSYAAVWHERFDADPGNAWLRGLLEEASAEHPPSPDDQPEWRELWGTRDSTRRRAITRMSGAKPI